MLQKITANIAPLIRHGKDAGRDYLVVPTVILTEGVHSGSNGPLFYPGTELAPSAPAWNGMPVLVYHAMVNGQYDSASHPEVAEKQQIGFLRNTRWKNGKLLTDCWIDESRARRIDERVLNSLVQGKPMEVSTGLYTENEEVHGEFRGKPYIAVARNYRPDHLAWLPDQIGACSLAAGCGTLKLNHAKAQFKEPVKLKALIDKILNSSNTQNIFCRTGKGGGRDPTCGKEGGGGSSTPAVDPREAKARKYEAQARSQLLEEKRKGMVATIKKLLSFDKNHPKLAEMRRRLDAVIEDKVKADQILAANIFCKTGQGGGVDPTCTKDSPDTGGGSGGGSGSAKSIEKQIESLDHQIRGAVQMSDPRDPLNADNARHVEKLWSERDKLVKQLGDKTKSIKVEKGFVGKLQKTYPKAYDLLYESQLEALAEYGEATGSYTSLASLKELPEAKQQLHAEKSVVYKTLADLGPDIAFERIGRVMRSIRTNTPRGNILKAYEDGKLPGILEKVGLLGSRSDTLRHEGDKYYPTQNTKNAFCPIGKTSRVTADDVKRMISNVDAYYKGDKQYITANCDGNCGGSCEGNCDGNCGGECEKCSEANASSLLTKRSSVMNKTQVINNLIASEVWNEDDRGWLESQSLGRLQVLAQSSCQEVEDALQNDDSNDGGQGPRLMPGKKDTGTYARNGKKPMMDDEASEGSPCANCEHAATCPSMTTNGAPLTLEQYVQRAPAEYREILTNSYNEHLQKKADLVQAILTNAEGLYTKAELESYNLNNLQRLAKLATPKTPATPVAPLFLGQAGGQLVGNAMDEEPLLPPVMNFANRAK